MSDRERLIGELRAWADTPAYYDVSTSAARILSAAAAMLEADAPTADDRATAERIVERHYTRCLADEVRDALVDDIAAALAAARRAGQPEKGGTSVTGQPSE